MGAQEQRERGEIRFAGADLHRVRHPVAHGVAQGLIDDGVLGKLARGHTSARDAN
jgi:hypothetical protein